MSNARPAQASDLEGLLDLFRASEVSPPAEPRDRAERIWSETLGHPGVTVFVAEAGARIVASCMLITAPNLQRGGRRHAFLENVVTHPECRGNGHGRAVVHAALAMAWACDCHHVLLQSGRQDGTAFTASIKAAASNRDCGRPMLRDAGQPPTIASAIRADRDGLLRRRRESWFLRET